MRREIRKKESDHQKTFVCNSKDSNFRISTHAKTLNCLNSLESKNSEERTCNSNHLKQVESKLRSTYCQPKNQQAAEVCHQYINTIELPQSMQCKTARVGTFSASRWDPAAPLHSIRPNQYSNLKTERQQRKCSDEAKQKQEPVRLSLTNFHEKLKSSSHSTNRIKKQQAEEPLATLKLEGINCRMKRSDNKMNNVTPIGRKKQASPNKPKKVIKLAIQQQSNLLQFNRILTKMQLEESNQSQQVLGLEVKKKTHRSKRAEAQSVSSFHKKSPIKQPYLRQNMKLSIINITEGQLYQDKARCNQIFMKYFAKREDFLERDEKEAPLTQSELIRELNDIKRQMALRNSATQRKQTIAEQKVGRYTTSFIEEKLLKRKSLIKNYTFKKGSAELRNEVGPFTEEYFVDGWNIQEADRAEVITS